VSNPDPQVGTESVSTERALWQVIEPFHTITYFAPEAREATDALRLRGGWMGYFASRAAPLGPVPAEVVIAIFYNFHPNLVRRAIPDAWTYATPEAVLAARLDGVDRAIRRLLGDLVGTSLVEEAAALAKEAASACELAGRPLYAANAALPWPDESHLVLWTAATHIREHRADGHVVALMAAGVDPCEAHVTIAATGATTGEQLRRHRWWSEDDWSAAVARLQARGWLDREGLFTPEGRAGRAAVEAETDRLAATPWRSLGPERTARLRRVMRAVSGLVVERGGIPIPNPMGLSWPPAPSPLDGEDAAGAVHRGVPRMR
jgi:hypothetical protein